MNKKKIWIACGAALTGVVLLILGIAIGRGLGNGLSRTSPAGYDKLNAVLNMIDEQYVDTVNKQDLTELTIKALMESLDPHSEYIPKSQLTAVNEDLDGSFSGVGISFQIVQDTVTVVEVITGGPAEKLGILAGDRIIKADNKPLAGPGVTNDDVFKTLRGKKGTKVTLSVLRRGASEPLPFTLTRDDIPVNSVDVAYMLDDKKTGYLKLSKFTRNTFQEFIDALVELDAQGAKELIIDLRNNPGGYLDQAALIANELLPEGSMIVYTRSRTPENVLEMKADGTGSHQKIPVAVLINEYSASASEIIAGAIQDNDRGVIIGRRSFGKGLVQNQTTLPDSSAIRLTVARYFTPSGRSIQKEYKIGEGLEYDMDIVQRYNRGEFYHLDSIKLDKTKPFRTLRGRTVYGGGGIMPDVFVPEDTTQVTSWYIAVSNAGLIQQYAFALAESYRRILGDNKNVAQILKILPADDQLVHQFAEYAESKGVPARWYYINISAPMVANQLKAFIVRDLAGYDQFYRIFNSDDRTIKAAVDVLKSGKIPVKTLSR
ncbi:MAG: S41 family peptidase [Muribaculaceae bacterium]|nr:S41 family peptidase [Bacteroidales bacterium]MDE6243838.1 S41 family peptidase [Muribaculaceae bacterium]